uniref:Uncharacterized protein n=1 Tax=Aegilops tauschii subsp. strangulata TaxID=200361 RepID=A0A453SX24_AEGTS
EQRVPRLKNTPFFLLKTEITDMKDRTAEKKPSQILLLPNSETLL